MKHKHISQGTFTRADLAKKIAITSKMSPKHAYAAIDIILDTLVDELKHKHTKSIKIRWFGTFSTVYKKERLGRNFKILKNTKIPAHWNIKWKCSPSLRARIAYTLKRKHTAIAEE